MIVQALLGVWNFADVQWICDTDGGDRAGSGADLSVCEAVYWWPQVFLGIAFNWGALWAWAAHSGSLTLTPVLLYLAGIIWTLFYDTIYAHQDKEDDALIGVKSTARLFAENTPRWLFIFQVIAMSLMLLAVVTPAAMAQLLPNPVIFLLVFVGIWGFGAHLTLQLRKLNIDEPLTCLHLFRSNREAV